MVRSFPNAASVSGREGRGGGGAGVGCPINAKSGRRRWAALQFREIKFMINLIEEVEVGLSSEAVLGVLLYILHSLSHSLAHSFSRSLASSQKSSIHNEPARRMDKSPRNIR